jgi:hypothetical protein
MIWNQDIDISGGKTMSKRGSRLGKDKGSSLPYQQMQLPLDELLDAHPGELIPLEIDVDDIGGELLAILSKGLYTDPLDCIREYVQNAVDANARTATIKITGNSVHIFDYGDGMSLQELVQARQFGLSLKSLNEHVGFRGIGIYSSFDLCNRLRVTSKKVGDTRQYLLVFEFGAMKAQLEEDKRKSTHEHKTSLVELLSKHTKVCRIQQPLLEEVHFTHIEMQEISDVHIKKLGNSEELKHYMIRNLPVDFEKDFGYRELINQQLHLEVPGYNAITLTLQFDGLPDMVVTKPDIPHLQAPKMGAITIGSGKNIRKVAYYWACLNTERDRLAQNARFVPKVMENRDRSLKLREAVEEEFRAYEGFVYKMKGFTVGNRDRLRHCFSSKPQLYPWYTGEVYVLDTGVVPKADRDDFETNEAKRALEFAVAQELSKLEDTAENFQATGVADERVEKYLAEIKLIENQVDTNTQSNDYETYTRLNEILKDLRRQQKKASPDKRSLASDIVKRAERLQKRLAKETETPQPEATKRKRAANEEVQPQSTQINFVEIQATRPQEIAENLVPVIPDVITPTIPSLDLFSAPTSPPSTPSLRRLENVLLETGWSLDGECARLVKLLQESLESIILDKALYHSILTDIEDRLNNGYIG